MKPKKPINIFIVEDNNVFTAAMKSNINSNFEEMQIKVYSFETGEACMNKFKIVKPQIVILDYHLDSKQPDAADGIEVLDWIKKENSETNVILLTSNDNLDIAIKSIKHGASDYVVKTETKFLKINYSLSNLFKLMKSKNEIKKYKNIAQFFIWFFAIQFGIAIASIIYSLLK
ncbi:MAG: hypothetical protein A2W98_13310 [Bacteroidetes bacterium GWF2_33_38]|nr:MAG: hypothetical protein A2W98_13310 [Bacteroidetes bacterium GWF2_33_38]OFY70065.1 MAG: hypothetical protein A2265_07105 [Bacteroidetes bacterium RIFOXYA12_FULL_33_9]OFY91819.1 MAG: hypothetical protein A2236_02940 [Bacteroidetes bacterium RIFOXYA2_FULL_33_7]